MYLSQWPSQIHSHSDLHLDVTQSDPLSLKTVTLMVTQSDPLSLRLLPWWWPSQIHSHSRLLPWWWPSQIHSHSDCYLDGDPVRSTFTQTLTLMVTQSDPLSLRLLPCWWPSQIHSHSDCYLDGDPVRSTLTQDCYLDGDPVGSTLTQTVTLMVTQSDPLSLRLYAHRDPSSVKQCPRRETVPSVDSLLGSKKTVASESKESCTYITLKHRHHGATSIQSRSHSSNQTAVLSVLAKSKVNTHTVSWQLRSQDFLHRDSHYMC